MSWRGRCVWAPCSCRPISCARRWRSSVLPGSRRTRASCFTSKSRSVQDDASQRWRDWDAAGRETAGVSSRDRVDRVQRNRRKYARQLNRHCSDVMDELHKYFRVMQRRLDHPLRDLEDIRTYKVVLDSDTVRYDTRCYFNVQSKADMSHLNLPHGTNNKKSAKTEKLKSKRRVCLAVSVNSPGNPWSQS